MESQRVGDTKWGLGVKLMCSASGYLVPAPQGHWPCVNTFHVPYLEVCVSSLFYSIPLRRRTLSPHITRTMYSCPAVVLIHFRWQYIWLHGTTGQPMIYFLRTEVSISKQIRVLFYKASKRLIVLKCRTLPPRRTILNLVFASSSKP